MDIRIGSEALAKHLSLYEKVVDRKPTIPVLSNVKITAGAALDGGLRLAATCLDVSLEGPCAGVVDSPGIVTVPAARLLEMAKALPGAEIRLWSDDKGAIRLKAGAYTSRLQALPAEDFPTLPTPETSAVQLPREAVRRCVAQVRYAIAANDTRYYLAGAQLALGDGKLTLVATDAHRIAVSTAALDGPEHGHIVPARALDSLAGLLGETGDAPVGFSQSGNHLFFAIDDRLLSARMVEGKFPAWQRIMPKGNVYEATIERAALRTAIQRVTLVSTGSARTITLKLKPGSLEVSALSSEIGQADEQIAIEYAGDPIDVSLQSEYLIDFLSEATSPKIVLAVKDAKSALLLSDGPDYLGVIMPVTL